MSGGASTQQPLLVHYLGVGRLHATSPTDNSIIASHCTIDDPQDQSAFAGWFRNLMTDLNATLKSHPNTRGKKVISGQDDASKNGLNVFFMSSPTADEKSMIVYFAVCAASYPERTPGHGASHLLWEFRANLMGDQKLAGLMSSAYENGAFQNDPKSQQIMSALCFLHGLDKFAAIDDALAKVKATMHGAISKQLENVEKLQELEDKAGDLEREAELWNNKTKDVATAMWWKNKKTQLILALVILIVLLVIIVPIAASSSTAAASAGDGGS